MNSVKVEMFRGLPKMNDKLRDLYNKFYDGDILLTIDKYPLKRSLAQNRYYHSVIKVYFFKLWRGVLDGITQDMTHEMLKRNFLPFEVVAPSGKVIVLYRSTKSLSVKEMSEFIEACRGYYLAETGEEIPKPLYMLENEPN